MWFDARAKLAEIQGRPVATPATPATNQAAPRVADVAGVAMPLHSKPAIHVAGVADVAAPQPLGPQPPEAFPYGTACGLGDMPRTWTGRVVSLADWRNLTDWERNGPKGMLWCGKRKQWVPHDG